MDKHSRWLLAVLAVTMLALLAGGAWFYRAHEQHLRQEAEMDLEAIARLKVHQIAEWRADQLGEAAELMQSPPFIEGVAQRMADPQAEDVKQILTRFRSLRDHYHYHDVLLVDAGGKVRLSLSGRLGTLHADAAEALAAALRDGKPALSDLHAGPGDLPAHVDVIAPLLAGGGQAAKPVGAVILQSDARQFLYPLIQSWPTPSPSAETLLVRREGDTVLYLNELRHQSDTALKLRIPLSRKDQPAVMAVLGREGVVQGKDYRGVDVLAVAKAVPGSPWFMVAKVDAAEAFSVLRRESALILALMLGLVAAAAGAVGVVWQYNGKAHYRALFESEAAVRKSRQLLQTMIDNAPLLAYAFDADGRCLLANRSLAALLQTSCESMIGKTRDAWLPQPIADSHRRNDLHVIETQRVATLEEVNDEPDGKHTYLTVKFPLLDARGSVYAVGGISTDITERKRGEAALRESEERYRTTLMSVGDGVIATDGEGRVELLNPVAEVLTGWQQSEARGKPLEEVFRIINEQTRREAENPVRRVMREGVVVGLANHSVLISRDGTERPIADSGAPIRDENGRIAGVVLVFRDRTAERAAQEALRRSEVLHRSLVEHLPQRIFIKDRDSVYVSCNANYARDLGIEPDGIAGKDDFAFYPRELADTYRADDQAVMVSGTLKDIEERYLVAGEERWVHTIKVPYHDQHGRVVGVLGIFEDITARRRAAEEKEKLQAQLLQSQKMEAIGQLAGGIAHDFRNQLTVVKGYAEMLLRRGLVMEQGKACVEQILQAADRSASMSEQLLAFGRRQELRPQAVNLDRLIGDLAKSLAHLLGEDIRLSIVPCDDLGTVRVDPGQFQQALMNLVLNARDAMPDGGQLTIETQNVVLDEEFARTHLGATAGPHVMVAVSDTGCGMDSQTLSRVFEPFFTTKPVGEGTGLGLPMVHGFVQQSGGYVSADSEPGQGSTFRVYLPRIEEPAGAESAPAPGASLPRGAGTILLVEDEQAVRRFVSQTLHECGYTVLEAANAQEAISLADGCEGRIDLLVADVVMPGSSGPELARHFQASRPEMRVLFISGYAGGMLADRGAIPPDANLLVKPISSSTLVEMVQKVLGSSRTD